MLPSPPLRTLLRLKWRGLLRRQGRRLRTFKGALLTIFGVALMGLWLGSIVLSGLFTERRGFTDMDSLENSVRLGCMALLALSLSSALTHRGLYLPREEIERLFAAPLHRSDLVRYRLWIGLARGLFGGVGIGLLVMLRMPNPAFAFPAVFLGALTLPVVNQLAAILLGAFETRYSARLRRLGTLTFALVAVLLGLFLFLAITGRELADVPLVGQLASSGALQDLRRTAFENPLLRALVVPLTPWVEAITATSAAEFLPWFGACLLALFALFELTARLPLDYRELSLATAASVAARIRRAQRGGGAAAARISRRVLGIRVPWLFGRSPGGAIAWRKTGAILRKARGTLIVTAVVLAFLTILSSTFRMGHPATDLTAPLVISLLGSFYLCSGLRFDFRDELDRMEVIKAWPLSPRTVFACMLAPQVALVSVLLIAALLVRGLIVGGVHASLIAVCLLQPLVVLAWVATDNALFLLAPTRFVPGQEGALQNAGRGFVLLVARLLVFAVAIGLGSLTATLAWTLTHDLLSWAPRAAKTAGFGALWGTLLVVDLGLLLLGGAILRRFDLSRDRG